MRFYHENTVNTTITINDIGSHTTEMRFKLIGDPVPLQREINVDHALFYSIEEMDTFRAVIKDLIRGRVFVPYLISDNLQIQVFFHLKESDKYLPEDSLIQLSEMIEQAMAGIFFPTGMDIKSLLAYKLSSSNPIGTIEIVIDNRINYYDVEFDN